MSKESPRCGWPFGRWWIVPAGIRRIWRARWKAATSRRRRHRPGTAHNQRTRVPWSPAMPLSDIEIAQRAHLRRIAELAGERLGIADTHLVPYGHYKAK